MTDYKKRAHTCRQCDHVWVNRLEREPKMCPKCKSVNWNEATKA